MNKERDYWRREIKSVDARDGEELDERDESDPAGEADGPAVEKQLGERPTGQTTGVKLFWGRGGGGRGRDRRELCGMV